MRRQSPPPDPRAREKAIEAAAAAGRLGLPRVPDEALFPDGRDPSDTGVLAVIEAFEAGRRERQADEGYRAAVDDEMLQLPESV